MGAVRPRTLASWAAFAFLALAAHAPSASAVFPGADGAIAYTGAFGTRVNTVLGDGSHRKNLISKAAEPAWSPNGRRIAFVRRREGSHDLFVAKANGKKARRVLRLEARVAGPAFSPDGRQIAFASDADGDLDIYVVNVTGEGLRKLVELPSADTSPAWSVDDQIAFDSTTGTEVVIHRIDPAGSSPPVSLGPGRDPSWSADGDTLVFVEGAKVVSTMDADGGLRAPVTTTAPLTGVLYEPTFSPSGAHIAVGRWSGSSVERFGQLVRIDLPGGGTTSLVTVTYVLGDLAPDWRASRGKAARRATKAGLRTARRPLPLAPPAR
jgi:Tol biopolymer transport system component